ncbi:DUF6241 domain-containing protein [Bacillus sp. 03113]|uniref:DUF6241 domain-containing protein n=1 Tax=Bacillus sp. 03113 TaxID=2578211 RepID=UPI0015E8B6D0|nr:DUF6241 domain-containing protein [Bacillus sp. 03113]
MVSVGILGLAGFGAVKVINNAKDYEKKEEIKKEEEREAQIKIAQIEKEREIEEKENEIDDKRKIIEKIQYDLPIDNNSTEEVVMDVMHQMTHQKVRAEKKEGAVPMNQETINQVYDIVIQSNFSHKDDLLKILDRWKKNNFEVVAVDHNYLWQYQDGEVGKAYGVLSLNEELEFARNHFQIEE